MKCPKCASENPDNAKYCNDCGASIDSLETLETLETIKRDISGNIEEKNIKKSDNNVEEFFSIGDVKTGKEILTDKKHAPNKVVGEGRYDFIECLGRGGMGEVWKAHDRRLKRLVAIKLIHQSLGQSDTIFARFLREAKTLAQVEHPNVVRIYDVNEEEFFISMEFIEGESISSRLRRDGPLELNTSISITIQIGRALEQIHKHGVIHRDIKPSNVLITPFGIPKLIDFGVAFEPNDSDITQEGIAVGTPVYMAPEQLLGAFSVDGRADMYSLGMMLYEMITGLSPRKINERRIPEIIRPIIMRSIEERREDRFPDMAAFIKALISYQESQENLNSYRETLRAVLTDGVITQEERALLQKRRQELRISLDDAQDAENEMRSELGLERFATSTSQEFLISNSIYPNRKSELSKEIHVNEGMVVRGDVFAEKAILYSGCEISGSVFGENGVVVEDNCRIGGGVFSCKVVEFGGSSAMNIAAYEIDLKAPFVLSGDLFTEKINPGGGIPGSTIVEGRVSCKNSFQIGPKCRIGEASSGGDIEAGENLEAGNIYATGGFMCGSSCKLKEIVAKQVTLGRECTVVRVFSQEEVFVGNNSHIKEVSGTKVHIGENCEIDSIRADSIVFSGNCRVGSVEGNQQIIIKGRVECSNPLIICKKGKIEIEGELFLDGNKITQENIFGIQSENIDKILETWHKSSITTKDGKSPASTKEQWPLISSSSPKSIGQIATTWLTCELNEQLRSSYEYSIIKGNQNFDVSKVKESGGK